MRGTDRRPRLITALLRELGYPGRAGGSRARDLEDRFSQPLPQEPQAQRSRICRFHIAGAAIDTLRARSIYPALLARLRNRSLGGQARLGPSRVRCARRRMRSSGSWGSVAGAPSHSLRLGAETSVKNQPRSCAGLITDVVRPQQRTITELLASSRFALRCFLTEPSHHRVVALHAPRSRQIVRRGGLRVLRCCLKGFRAKRASNLLQKCLHEIGLVREGETERKSSLD